MKKKLKITVLCLLSVAFAYAQKDSILPVVKIDTAILAIGDQTHLRISLPVPKGKQLIFPDFTEKIGKSLEILSKTIDTLQLKDGQQQITHDYLVTSFDTGYIAVPPFEVGIVEQGYNSTITTDTMRLYVTYPIVDMKKGIFDIKPPADLPFKFSELLPYAKIAGIILLILVLIVGALLYYFFIYKKKKTVEEVVEDTRPADVKALEKLEKLKAEQLWQAGKIKQYYSELTDIVRHYLDERFAMHTMESTSNEILKDLNNQAVNTEGKALLRYIFEYADVAKFAKGQPLPNENDKSLQNAVQFVEQTKIVVVEETKKGGVK